MVRRPPAPAATRVFTREHDFTGSSAEIVGNAALHAFAAAVERRNSAASLLERDGFSYRPGPRLLDREAMEALSSPEGRDDLVVAILVDQSGGLRGEITDRIVSCVDRLALSLEAAGVAFEVLGFSTLRWKGGLARELWIAEGRKESPGRLCDLMHVIHKEAAEGWSEGTPSPRERLDLMLRDPYMREGLDGEAVAWALDRLAMHDRSERVLVVVGDATPIEDATIQVESRAFLEADLVRSVRRAAREGVAIETVAVKADAAVAEFYPKTTYIPAEGDRMDPVAASDAILKALDLAPRPEAAAGPRA